MTGTAKIISLLIFGALAVLVVTHPAGAAGDAVAGGSVLDNTLAIESGSGVTSGTKGSVNGVGTFA
jgi:hypothetical protein